MTITETSFNHKIGNGSSYIVYICKDAKAAQDLHNLELTKMEMMEKAHWYYHVSTLEVVSDCRIPKFFHKMGLTATVIEHNNGNWDANPTYKLFIVE